jgi:streptogramin lyase
MRASDPHIGSDLLGYEIEEVIGRGGMGVVYRARDRALERNVALKLIAPEYAGFTGFRGRFLEESRLAASLEHPNVVPIYAAGDQDGHLYIAMRYIEGRDLRQVLRDGVLEPSRAIAICRQVASALDAAHQQDLVHRDVKPSNILLDASGRAYLADFGLSRLSSDAAKPPEVEASLGTIDYVAPEQIRGDAVDGRADVYSLGCVLYECLTGGAPFANRSDVALLYAHLEEEPPTAPGLEQVLAKALAKDPQGRYATCGEFVEAATGPLGVSQRSRSRWRSAAVAAIAAAIASIVVAGLLTRGQSADSDRAGLATAGASGAAAQGPFSAASAVPGWPGTKGLLIRVDGETGSILDPTFPIGNEPTAVAAGAGAVWATSHQDDVLWRLDPDSGLVTTVATGGAIDAVGLATARDAVYAMFDDESNGMERISPDAHPPVAHVVLSTGHKVKSLGDPTQVASGPAGVWGVGGDTVYKVKFSSGFSAEAVDLVPIPAIEDDENARDQLSGLAVGDNTVWVIGDVGDQRLWQIDTTRDRLVAQETKLGFAPSDVAVGLGYVWVTGQITNKLYKIDPATGQVVQRIPVGHDPIGVDVGAGAVWVANAVDGTISKYDPQADETVSISVGASPIDVSVGDGSVWVVAGAT